MSVVAPEGGSALLVYSFSENKYELYIHTYITSVATHFNSCNSYKIKLIIAFLFYVYACLGYYNKKNMAFCSLIHKYNLTQMPEST